MMIRRDGTRNGCIWILALLAALGPIAFAHAQGIYDWRPGGTLGSGINGGVYALTIWNGQRI